MGSFSRPPSPTLQAANSQENAEQRQRTVENQLPRVDQAAAEVALKVQGHGEIVEGLVHVAAGVQIETPQAGDDKADDDENRHDEQGKQGRHHLVLEEAAD